LWPCLLASPGRAETAEERIAAAPPRETPAVEHFRRAHDLLIRADEARDRGDHAAAVGAYREALAAYAGLAQRYPEWQPGVTRFRISYCDSQIEALVKLTAGAPLSGAPPAPPADPGDKPALPLAPPAPEMSAAREDAAREAAARARLLMAEGRDEEARAALVGALRDDPDDPAVRTLLGLTHCRAGEYQNAMYVMEAVVFDNPSDPIARLALGAAYFGIGRMADAREQVERAIVIEPESAAAHFNLAQIMLAADPPDIAAARLHYDKAVELGAERDEAIDAALGETEENAGPAAPAAGPDEAALSEELLR